MMKAGLDKKELKRIDDAKNSFAKNKAFGSPKAYAKQMMEEAKKPELAIQRLEVRTNPIQTGTADCEGQSTGRG